MHRSVHRSITDIWCSIRMIVSRPKRRFTSKMSSISRVVSSLVIPADGSSKSSRRGRLIRNFILARCRFVHPGEHVEEGGLSRAVGTDQAEELALEQIEAETVQCQQTAEATRQIAARQQRRGGGVHAGWPK